MKKKGLLICLLVVCLFALAGYFYMFQDHRDISVEDATFTLTVSELKSQFTDNAVVANAKYIDQTIAVTGTITSIDKLGHAIVLDQKLSAVLKDSIMDGVSPQMLVKVKGRFLGYDDLLEELKIDEAMIIQ
jgi:hypothetical protein